MEVLAEKFEIYRDAVLSELDVNEELLKLLTEKKLIGEHEGERYKAVTDRQQQNLEVMTAMTQVKTARAYPTLLECLRNTGQVTVADLLTDLTRDPLLPLADDEDEEKDEDKDDDDNDDDVDDNRTSSPLSPVTDVIADVQYKLDSLLKQISPFLSKEERRVGLVTKTTPKQHNVVINITDTAYTSLNADQIFMQTVHDTMVNAMIQLKRSEDVINKLHTDCQTVADINSDIMSEVKRCDIRAREILRTYRLPVVEVPVPQRATELFRVLIDDINTLIEWKSRVLVREQETRTKCMRILRKCRDWLDERCQILNQVTSKSSRTRPRTPGSNTRLAVDHSPNSTFSTSPALSLEVSRQNLEVSRLSPSLSRHSHQTETDGQSEIRIPVPFPIGMVDPRPIRSVMAGLNLLEDQIREYIRLELLMTEEFRSQQRMKRLQNKAQGYSSRGFHNARQHVDRIEQGIDIDENLASIRGILAKSSDEYEQCVHYMKKVTDSMPRAPETYVLDISRDSKSETSNSKFSFFKKKPKEVSKGTGMHLPKLVQGGTVIKVHRELDSHNMPLLSRLKTLVLNYQAMKNNEKVIVERFRLDLDRKKKEVARVIRKKEEEVVRLQFRLKETAADRDKYRRLYEQMKLTYGRKR